jgi:hypothetical protein
MVKMFFWTMRSLVVMVVFLTFLPGCAEIQLGSLSPSPPPSAKLRVFILPISGSSPRHGWRTPDRLFEKKTYRTVKRILWQTDMYETVPRRQVQKVLGKERLSTWQLARDDWALARRVGRALYAEYVMIVERGWQPAPYFKVVLLNVDSGNRFVVFSPIPGMGKKSDWIPVIRASYRRIFQDAKKDLLATATRKGRLALASGATQQASAPKDISSPRQQPSAPPVSQAPEALPPTPVPRPISSPTEKISYLPPADLETLPEKAAGKEARDKMRTQIAVYDFDSSEQLKVVALILADALREELLRYGNITLVNREDIKRVIEELSLGQVGLVDAKQAIEAGKALAAEQMLVGRLAVLGDKAVLQVKRIDTTTQRTLALGSIKCKLGNEEEFLASMPGLTRDLMQAQ